MTIPSITTYSADNILVKEAFRRAIPAVNINQSGVLYSTSSVYNDFSDPLRFVHPSQSDFMREYDLNSHIINTIKYYPNPIEKDEEGRFYQKVKTRIALALQQVIHTKRVDCLTGNNVNLRVVSSSFKKDTTKYQDILDKFREYWEEKNIEIAISGAIATDGKVGDAAIGYYMHNGKAGYRLFSFEKGDVLYPHYNPITGRLCLFGRKFSQTDINGVTHFYIDVWDDRYYCRYTQTKEGDSLWDGTSKWVVDISPIPHLFPRIPIVYTRYGEPFWANSQDLIDKLEISLSQLAENNMAYALRILYSFGGEMDMKASIDGTPTQIASPDPNAKVGFLEPADSSGSFGLQLKVLEDNIYRCSFAVKTPELKSGSDLSSLTVKMLFADAFQKAQQDAKFYQEFLDGNVELAKYCMGIEYNMTAEMEEFRVKAKLFPYVFLSETEEVANLMQLKSVGGLSKRTLTEQSYEMGYGTIDEYKRVLQEDHDELVGQDQNTPAQSPITGGQTSSNTINNARLMLDQQ